MPDGTSSATALVEVVGVGALYVLGAHAFLAVVDLSAVMPSALSAAERAVGSDFLTGAIAQLLIVLVVAAARPDMRQAMAATVKLGNRPAWTVVAITCVIDVTTLLTFFVDDPTRVYEVSPRNVILSLIPGFDGWTQEVMFRGYVLYRLARGGLTGPVQIAASAVLFSAIHVGYAGQGAAAIWPLVGTAALGAFFAWAVRLGKGALLPVVVGHTLVVLVAQPWLSLAR